ncbi:helix-turn-helix domain-containing protein [Streptomyces sp. NPDC096132]|uniref:helix-turn-helix domain-containing protein n=1 Tax=Streptomyces sp. NPDC096132 TaxID=3366075 RepID=UPI0038197E2D
MDGNERKKGKGRAVNRPPFSPAVAVSARQGMGLSPQQVTEQMRVCGAPVDPAQVHAWEAGEYRPTEDELFVLADVLWCRTTDLMGIEEPSTLAEHRLARQFSTAKLARRIGMNAAEYVAAEERNRWTGNGRQTVALLRTLNLTPLQLTKATGQTDMLGIMDAERHGKGRHHDHPRHSAATRRWDSSSGW